jgi:hypothetical protein
MSLAIETPRQRPTLISNRGCRRFKTSGAAERGGGAPATPQVGAQPTISGLPGERRRLRFGHQKQLQ